MDEEFGITINWVFDIVRDLADPAERRRRAEYTTAEAIDGNHLSRAGGTGASWPADLMAVS